MHFRIGIHAEVPCFQGSERKRYPYGKQIGEHPSEYGVFQELIEKDGEGKNVIFSTTNYHVYRSGMYANEAGLHAEGIGSKTKWYFWSNAFIREFIALLVSGAKKHAANVVVLLMLSLMSGCAAYASMM